MGVLLSALVVLCLLALSPCLPELAAQPALSPSSLNALLQDYAYRALARPRTGIPYDAAVPSNLTGIALSALRLRSGSLFRRRAGFKEFAVPVGVLVTPYVERLVLVYRNLGNWSTVYYPLPGYTYLAPVLGLIAYDALDLSAKNLPELDLRATRDPISIKFGDVDQVPAGAVAKCVWFDLNGSPSFSNVVSNDVCSTVQQGHFSIVVPSLAPSPAPRGEGKRGKKGNKKVWIIVGSVLGGLLLLGLLAVLVIWCRRFRERKKMRQMERASETGEALHMTPVGNTKAPAATVTRTQPVLESEYVP